MMRRSLPALALAASVAFAGCSGSDTPSAPAAALTIETTVVDQTSDVSSLVYSVPSVTVRNSRGAGVPNVLVTWTVLSGGGSVVNATSRTNSAGVASSGGWTLGPAMGVQQLQASVSGLGAVVFTATATAAPATRLVSVTTAVPATTVGTAVATPLAVRAEDANGRAVANVPVLFSVTTGGGTIVNAQTSTNASGVATAGTWTLGNGAGMQTVRATASGLTSADFTVTALAAAPASLVIVAGDNQTAPAGTAVQQPPIVRVVDAFGNNVGNVPVTFTPGTGSGTVTGGTVTTDPATGTAIVSAWTLGTATAQTLVATSSAIAGTSVTFRATGTATASQFDIDVRFIGDGGTDRQREAFAKAVARWRRVITGDIGSTLIKAPAGECTSWIPAVNETVNDVVIFVRLATIDGAGKILGQASPCYVNSTNRLPVMGFFELDVDDMTLLLNQGTLDDVVLHEMGHILGIGTLWTYQRTLLTGRGTEDPYFNGLATREQFAGISGNVYTGTPVPVENAGGTGTRDSHWRRSVFANELMQGYATPGGMPMSRVTIASLSDLGYQVSFSGSDSYSFFPSLRTLPAGKAISLGDDVAPAALWEVQRNGTRRKVRERPVRVGSVLPQ